MYFDNFQSAKEPHSVRALSTVGRSDEDLLSEVLKRDRGINSQWEFVVWLRELKLGLCNKIEGWAGEGNGKPLQNSCLENLVDRGAWRATVHRVAQSQARLKQLSMHACIGQENGNPFQYSCLEDPRDRGAWWAAVYRVIQSWTRLKQLSSSKGVGWGGRLEGGSVRGRHRYTYGWFMLMFGRNQHKIVEQLSFN